MDEAVTSKKKWKWSPLLRSFCDAVLLPPSLVGFPSYQKGVLCLICSSLKSAQLPPLHFPLHISFTSLLRLCPSLSSSTILSFFPLLLCSYHLSDRLFMPCFVLPLSSLSASSSSSSIHSVYPCITVTTVPAPATKLFLGELTCEWRAASRRKECKESNGIKTKKSVSCNSINRNCVLWKCSVQKHSIKYINYYVWMHINKLLWTACSCIM